jgi:hypothetical protein
VEHALAPPLLSIQAQKKGYALVPHFDVAPRDISSLVSEDNIILGRRRANNIIMEPLADNPLMYFDAVHSDDAVEWVAAINNELQNMERHVVWSVHPLLPGCKPLLCKWVFKKKFNMFGEIDKFKARLVV